MSHFIWSKDATTALIGCCSTEEKLGENGKVINWDEINKKLTEKNFFECYGVSLLQCQHKWAYIKANRSKITFKDMLKILKLCQTTPNKDQAFWKLVAAEVGNDKTIRQCKMIWKSSKKKLSSKSRSSSSAHASAIVSKSDPFDIELAEFSCIEPEANGEAYSIEASLHFITSNK